MGITRFPHGIQAFPDVGGGNFGMSTGSTIYFVDDINGGDGNDGTSPGSALKTVEKALDLANAWDVIYILPKPWATGNFWINSGYAATTADLSIAYAKQGLAMIGVGHQGLIGVPYGVVITERSGSTGALLKCYAPMCAFENLSFYRGTTSINGLWIQHDNENYPLQYEGSLPSIYNCHFQDIIPTAAGGDSGGAIYAIGVWGITIDSCSFMGCRIGISVKAENHSTGKILIQNNTFWSRLTAASDISADIYVLGAGSCCMSILHNMCAHLIPSYSGGHGKWIQSSDVRQGLVAFNSCGGVTGTNYTVGPTGTGISIPTNVGHGPNWTNAALMASTSAGT